MKKTARERMMYWTSCSGEKHPRLYKALSVCVCVTSCPVLLPDNFSAVTDLNIYATHSQESAQ